MQLFCAVDRKVSIHPRRLRNVPKDGLRETGLPEGAIQPIPTRGSRRGRGYASMSDLIDFIVPRGGRSLIERVMEETRIPVIAHLDGNCHVYLHADADRQMARDIVSNAKMRRTGICGAAESLVIDEASASDLLPLIVDDLSAAGCEIRGDAAAQQSDARIVAASDDDWAKPGSTSIRLSRSVLSMDWKLPSTTSINTVPTIRI